MQKLRHILSLCLSVYLLVLMVVPCAHAHHKPNTAKQQTVSALNTHQNHDDEGICTPFCVCGTCMAAIVLQPVSDYRLQPPQNPSTRVNVFYRQHNSSFHGAIWQPPKLA